MRKFVCLISVARTKTDLIQANSHVHMTFMASFRLVRQSVIIRHWQVISFKLGPVPRAPEQHPEGTISADSTTCMINHRDWFPYLFQFVLFQQHRKVSELAFEHPSEG